jgi:hypothetical protein
MDFWLFSNRSFAAYEALEAMMWLTRIGFGLLFDAGEAAQGSAAAAIANAFSDATGIRMRELPLTPKRVKAVFGV